MASELLIIVNFYIMKGFFIVFLLIFFAFHSCLGSDGDDAISESDAGRVYYLNEEKVLETIFPAKGVVGNKIFWKGEVVAGYQYTNVPEALTIGSFAVYKKPDEIQIFFDDTSGDGKVDSVLLKKDLRVVRGFRLLESHILVPFEESEYSMYRKFESGFQLQE